MSERLPIVLRTLVIERAAGRCEYCLTHASDSFLSHEIDHVVAIQHGGETTADNLALSCHPCNRFKGPNLTSIDPETGLVVELFNPRQDRWDDHFELTSGRIVPQTATGRVTEFLLQLNTPDRIEQRRLLIRTGRYP